MEVSGQSGLVQENLAKIPKNIRSKLRLLLISDHSGVLWRTVGFVCVLVPTLLVCALASARQPAKTSAEVIRVIDGDSLKLSDGSEVRMIGIDAPEFKDQKRNIRAARRLGVDKERYAATADAARRFVGERVFGVPAAPAWVELEFDDANVASKHRDKYGRLLAYVWLPAQDRSVSLNALMVKEGFAATYPYFPSKYSGEFKKLEDEARIARKGMWSTGK